MTSFDFAQIDLEDLTGARELFEAYCEGVGGIAYNGDKIPQWHEIQDKARYGWVCVYRKAKLTE